MDFPLGESAALTTAILWTACSIFFASAGRRIGALSLNAWRILMAVCFLGTAHILLFGTIVPAANQEQYGWMALSGIIGLAIGDFGYFGCLVCMGPRRGVLLMSMHPIFTAILAWIWLHEYLSQWTVIGIAMVLTGVIIAILEQGHVHDEPITRERLMLGGFFGLVGSAGQGIGIVVAKYGMVEAASPGADSLDPLSATLIRMVAACIFVWLAVLVTKNLASVLKARKDIYAMKRTFAGALSGPFLGVWMSMIAVTYALAGVAATLMSLMPILIIPVVYVLYKEKTSMRGIMGAVIAFIGVAVLFLM